MAYFIVIGTDSSVKNVVDEVRESHLQHNIVTSGCIISQEDGLYYHWDVYNANGDKQGNGKNPSVSLRDALTNQIAQFKTLLPNGAIPHVFLIGSCIAKDNAERIKSAYKALCDIGGSQLNNITIDVVLLGYDLDYPENVTIRPGWKDLRDYQGLKTGRFLSDVLYINNMDYDGAATNIDAKLLGRLLSHWAKFLTGADNNPKIAVQSRHYAIGIAERQYNFDDLAPFFKLAAEERILDRALHDKPSDPTLEMLGRKYYKFIHLDKPWIDGLCSIKDSWESYCTYKFDYEKELKEQPYSLSVQQQQLALYLNDWLKLYCGYLKEDIERLAEEINKEEAEVSKLESSLTNLQQEDPETGELIETEDYKHTKRDIQEGKKRVTELKHKEEILRKKIEQNTFADARDIREDLKTGLLTSSQMDLYNEHREGEKELFAYLNTDNAVITINEAKDRALNANDPIPECPNNIFENVGRLEELQDLPKEQSQPEQPVPEAKDLPQKENPGCIGRLIKWFVGDKKDSVVLPDDKKEPEDEVELIPEIDVEGIRCQVVKSIQEYKKIAEVKDWWNKLESTVKSYEDRQKECKDKMDGVILSGKRVGGYEVPFHRKSISLIDIDKARKYRDNDDTYKSWIEKLKNRYFDDAIEDDNRQSMQELIKHQVIDAIRGQWHTLRWDGQNPFCNELFSEEEIHDFIEDNENGTHKQSKPFVEYVELNTQNLAQSINYLFYFNHPKIERDHNAFRNKYGVSQHSLIPVYLPELNNSLCEVQVIDLADYIDNLADFRPRRETPLFESTTDYKQYMNEIVGQSDTIIDKARAIYDWLCNNISYDTTYQIHDADKCWQTKRGVCQAYCELFVRLAELVGVTADIVTGKSKDPSGNVSDQGHSWIFVYTKGYDGIFIDPTWGAGYVKDGVFTKSPTDEWFDVNPDWLIFSHYADNTEWNKTSTVVDYDQFEKLPFKNPEKEKGETELYRQIAEQTHQ